MWSDVISRLNCRVEVWTDTCHAEGNWRSVWKPWTWFASTRYTQLELDLGNARGVSSSLQLIQWAGCREGESSYGDSGGGDFTWRADQILGARPYPSRTRLFTLIHDKMPPRQEPAFSTYNASDEFLTGEAFH